MFRFILANAPMKPCEAGTGAIIGVDVFQRILGMNADGGAYCGREDRGIGNLVIGL